METATGEHVLLKRYTPLELHGDLEDLYNHRDRDYLWYLEPPDDSTEPTRDELESALAQQDRLHASAKEPAVDSGLPDGMRQRLFAIRAHLARVPAVLQLESKVRGAMSQAEVAVHGLEPLAAWSNIGPGSRTSKPASSNTPDRSDREIDSTRDAESQALKTLPPDISRDEDTFPAMERNVIIRIRRAPSRNPQNTAVNQTRAGVAMRSCKASPDDVFEEVYDEYASDEVSPGS